MFYPILQSLDFKEDIEKYRQYEGEPQVLTATEKLIREKQHEALRSICDTLY